MTFDITALAVQMYSFAVKTENEETAEMWNKYSNVDYVLLDCI